MSFNLVLDEPGKGDKTEEHDGLQFIVESGINDTYGPFTLSTIKQGSQTFLQLDPGKRPADDEGGGCGSCSSC